MNRYSIIILMMSIMNYITGFGAMPSKPDFAYPQTVSKNAQTQLKKGISENNGPAIVRAALDYGLAQTEINPDAVSDFVKQIDEIKQQVDDPATIAMLDFVAADASDSDSLALNTLNKFTDVLRKTSINEWLNVVDTDEKFTPTLYDFAVLSFESLLQNDSIRNQAIAYNVNNQYPRILLELHELTNFDSALSIYHKFKGFEVEAYALASLAERASTIQQRTHAYNLCCESQSPLTEIVNQAKAYLTRSKVEISGPKVVKAGEKFKIKVKATCTNEVKVTVKNVATVKEFKINIPGKGVFQNEREIECILPDYGRYTVYPTFANNDSQSGQDSFDIIVTDFLLTKQRYGSCGKAFALDAIDGQEQTDVEIDVVNNYIVGKRGADRYTPRIFNYAEDIEPTSKVKHANLYTDRAIYHPGDKLRFAATLLEINKEGRKLISDCDVLVHLYNANRIIVDSLPLMSDSYGRISGEFDIPKDGLTGYYRIDIQGYNGSSILVSEYKAPTFEVEMSAHRIDSSTVELMGKAIGYNGFPISDANVAVEIAQLPDWIWFRQFRSAQKSIITTDTIQTDADGTFSTTISIPDEKRNLAATAIVSSPTGESHEVACFLPSASYFISADIPRFLLAGTRPVISIVDSDGQPTNREYEIHVRSNDTDSVIEPNDTWDNVPSGAYTAQISSNGAKDFKSEIFYVYRNSDSMPPLETALFVPRQRIETGDKLLIGTSYDNSHILYTLWTPRQIIEQKWLKPESGNLYVDVNLPDTISDATLSLFTLHNYEFITENVKISRPNKVTSLNIHIESLRDKITPGDRETWTIKVTDNLGVPADAAVLLNLYAKALDALQPYSIDFHVPSASHLGYRLNFDYPWVGNISAHEYQRVPAPITLNPDVVSFNLYDQVWPRLYSIPYRAFGAIAMNKAYASEVSDLHDTDAIVEESAAELCTATADAGQPGNPDDNDMRMPEIPVAFWAPVLNTDSAGQLQIQFVAPNATTTWAVKALAYNQSLVSGKFSSEIVSSKPVMVQPNLPRFLRIGDKINIRASVINNTDSAATVQASFELFEPVSGNILLHKDFSFTLNAMTSDVISIDYSAYAGTMLGVRVKATSGQFTDGEQSVLPILPNDISVINSRAFYLPADSIETNINIPQGGVLTLTANAIWECVAALPGLQVSESKSAFSAVGSLFSAATARGLMRQHPEIAIALHQWQQKDSVLISRLVKNEDLKIALLNSSPFINAARSESEQKARLTLLFDNAQIENVIKESTHNLAKLVKNGGLSWIENSTEPSLWITLKVMSTLARLKQLGYLPQNDRLNRLITNAVKYLDDEVARQYAKNKNLLFIDYVLMRSQFPNIRQTSPAKRAAAATVQYLVGNWREESLIDIAKAAIILHQNNYPTTARSLTESLRQHEVWKFADINSYYLDAFSIVEPESPEVDMIRSAYISRLQSMDWGNGISASNLIAAILNSGTPWLVPASNELSISIDGTKYEPSTNDVMGQVRIQLPKGGNVMITKGKFPTWGGVFAQIADSIHAIEAFASEDLKITQNIEGDLKVGSKIKLTLTIDASRDLDYVIVRQPRCAAFEPTNQLPSTLWLGYLAAYREPCSTETNWFFNRITKGRIEITEYLYLTAQGTFALAPAEVQSQYAPEFKANSAGREITISE